MDVAAVLGFTLCFFFSNGTAVEPDCTFDIYLMRNEPYRWIEQGTSLTNTVGIIQYDKRLIYINTDYKLPDRWGDTTWRHEAKHAIGWLMWERSGYQGKCPCSFHD